MAAKFTFVCLAPHNGEDNDREGPTTTIYQGGWAYCAHAGFNGHNWSRVDGDGVTLEEIKTHAHRSQQPV